MGSSARGCKSSFEPKCPAADHLLTHLSGILPMGIWGADDCTGSRLSATQPVSVLGLVSPTPEPVPLIAVQVLIKDPPWGSQCITCLEGIISDAQASSIVFLTLIGKALQLVAPCKGPMSNVPELLGKG